MERVGKWSSTASQREHLIVRSADVHGSSSGLRVTFTLEHSNV